MKTPGTYLSYPIPALHIHISIFAGSFADTDLDLLGTETVSGIRIRNDLTSWIRIQPLGIKKNSKTELLCYKKSNWNLLMSNIVLWSFRAKFWRKYLQMFKNISNRIRTVIWNVMKSRIRIPNDLEIQIWIQEKNIWIRNTVAWPGIE